MLKIFIGKLLRKFGYKITSYESVPFNKKILEVYEVLYEIIQIVENRSIEGAFVECGYGQGRSFAVLSHFAGKSGRKIFGFDSFEGFPNITPADYSSRNPKRGEWSVRTLKEANKFVKSLGIFKNNSTYNLKKLIFDANTSNPIPNEKIALLHIDLDLYEGYKYALEIFFNQIQIGGIILFDEYNSYKWPGATKAVNEFLTSKSINTKHIKEIRGKYYLIKSE